MSAAIWYRDAAASAGTGAGSIDQHFVELAAQLEQAIAVVVDLNVAGAGPLQPLDDRRQPPPVAVIGMDWPLLCIAADMASVLPPPPAQ